jgi:hypothetical protein
MTNKEFIKKLDNHRNNTHQLIEGDGDFNIKRGMGHTMSGYVEDLFALFIAQKINSKKKQFLVDKVTSIRFKAGEKAKSFKPDLSIIDSETMTHYFDLKTNLGWNREFEEYLKQKDDFVKRLRGKVAWIRHSKTEVQDITISKNLIYQMVVVYGWNINQEILKKNLNLAKNFKNLQVHILYHKNHENDMFEINDLAFTNIFKTL